MLLIGVNYVALDRYGAHVTHTSEEGRSLHIRRVEFLYCKVKNRHSEISGLVVTL